MKRAGGNIIWMDGGYMLRNKDLVVLRPERLLKQEFRPPASPDFPCPVQRLPLTLCGE